MKDDIKEITNGAAKGFSEGLTFGLVLLPLIVVVGLIRRA